LTVRDEVPGVDVHIVEFAVVVVVVEGDVVVEVVEEVVAAVVDEVVAVVVDEVVVIGGVVTQELEMVLVSMVTSPVCAKAAPCRVAPVARVTLE
jgi:hypothetical protein